ncbi:rhomboid family intramembrane serine protease [Myroides sp. M-43]|uniref:rhomboid family intramembrane serine protease n=1 Tax=Myroides oncorhynchi TaxID=2893756 RepID=UPI001E4C5E67|nr:rhomboid family intramembrane serine protease [Myroides oncorhynchi]MCC9041491.1 rhomboid family intramembrane serine protease [Myroides oncorhynchi]
MSKILDDLKYQYRAGGIAQKIIYWNVGIGLVVLILNAFFSAFSSHVLSWLVLNSNLSVLAFKPWTILTYSFIHAGVIHLLFNMIMLFFVNRLFSTFFSEKQFLTLYIFGALFGGIFFVIGSQFMTTGAVLVGASAATIAPLVAIAVHAPMMQVRLALIGNVKMWHIAVFIIVLDVIQLNTSNVGGHLAHLGGAVMGYLYIKLLEKGYDLSSIFDKISNLFKRSQGAKFKKVYVNKKVEHTKNEVCNEGKTRQQQIDKILDKISKSGYESLTKDEKDFLFRSGNK